MRAAFHRAHIKKGTKMKAVIFDTETTGLIDNRTVHLDKQPHMIEFFGQLVNLANGETEKEYSTLIKPPIPLPLNVKNGKGIADMTGISEEMLEGQPSFKEVAEPIHEILSSAPCIIAHNLRFDMDMVEVELERLKRTIAWPKRQICSIEQTVHLRGHRLNLTKLHQILFPGETFTAHRAGEDVKALTRCCVELYKREII
jgi:DNA polymerase III epsilon subunit-like protein